MIFWIKKFFKKKRFEYLYFYVIGNDIFGDKEKAKISTLIQSDISKHKKVISDYDLLNNDESGESVIILTTENKRIALYRPLLFEIYAFIKKNKELEVISYPFEYLTTTYIKQLENNQQEERPLFIFKFKLEC